MSVSKADVAQAMRSIEARGDNPSADRILEELGRGNKGFVLDLKKKVLTERAEAHRQTLAGLKDQSKVMRFYSDSVTDLVEAIEVHQINLKNKERELLEREVALDERIKFMEMRFHESNNENRCLKRTKAQVEEQLNKAIRDADVARAEKHAVAQERDRLIEEIKHHKERLLDTE